MANVDSTEGLKIETIEAPLIYLYWFQAWCPGCHSHGFPTMKSVKEAIEGRGLASGVCFIAVQTVLEGHDQNGVDQALESVARHGLMDIPLNDYVLTGYPLE